MKLFIVLYIAGKIGGTIGPLPYNAVECSRRTAELVSQGDPYAVTPEGLTINDIQFVCEWHAERPELER